MELNNGRLKKIPNLQKVTEIGNTTNRNLYASNYYSYSGLFIAGSNNPAIIRGMQPNGSSATGVILDSYYNLTASGSKLLSVRNAGVEKVSIDKDGKITTYGSITGDSIYSSGAKISGWGSNPNPMLIQGTDSDSSDAIGIKLKAYYTLTSDGAKLVSILNSDVEKAYFDKDGGLSTNGGRWRNVTTVNSATYSLSSSDDIINVTYTSTGATSITLPSAQVVEGRTIVIKDASGNANTNNIIVNTEGSEIIDGSATLVINIDYGSATIYSDGNNWFII